MDNFRDSLLDPRYNSRRALYERLNSLLATDYDVDRMIVEGGRLLREEQPDEGGTDYLQSVLFDFSMRSAAAAARSRYLPDAPSVRQYVLTLTTTVTSGVPHKDYPAFMQTLRKILALPGVEQIVGNFELTQQNALHAHVLATVTLPKYLDVNRVRAANLNEHVKQEMIRSAAHEAACLKYINKDVDTPAVLAVLSKHGVTTSVINMSKGKQKITITKKDSPSHPAPDSEPTESAVNA